MNITTNTTQTQDGEEVMVVVPLSLIKELNNQPGGKLVDDLGPASGLGLSAAALGRRDRTTCLRNLKKGDYQVKLVRSVVR